MPYRKPLAISHWLFVSITVIFLLLLLPTQNNNWQNALGQTPYEKAKADYLTQLKKYNDAHNSYITAKTNYKAFQTAAAKKEAFEKTKIYLFETNFLLVNKLLVIKTFGEGINWDKSEYSKDELFKYLDEEIDFLQDNYPEIQQTTSLEQLPPLADILNTRLENNILPKADKAIATFEIVKTDYSHKNFQSLYGKVKDFASSRIIESNKAILSNWQSEMDRIDESVKINLEQSKVSLEKIRLDEKSNSAKNNVLKQTNTAKSELTKSLNLFEEILRFI